MFVVLKCVKIDYIGMFIDECLFFYILILVKWIIVRDVLIVGNDIVVCFVFEGDIG